jgi:hypothetical protein
MRLRAGDAGEMGHVTEVVKRDRVKVGKTARNVAGRAASATIMAKKDKDPTPKQRYHPTTQLFISS